MVSLLGYLLYSKTKFKRSWALADSIHFVITTAVMIISDRVGQLKTFDDREILLRG